MGLDRIQMRYSKVYSTATTYGLGGGIANYGIIMADHCILSGWSNPGGGAIANFGTFILSDSLVTDSFGAYVAGGIYNFGSLLVSGSTIANNESYMPLHGQGGGIFNDGDAVVINSTIYGNRAALAGAGISAGRRLVLDNSTVTMNHVLDLGLWGGAGLAGSCVVKNSLIIGNYGYHHFGLSCSNPSCPDSCCAPPPREVVNDCTGTFVSEGNNLIGALTGFESGALVPSISCHGFDDLHGDTVG
jgi:hypothetical protein